MKKDCKLFLYITLAFCLMIVPCKNIYAADQGWYSQNGKVFYQLDGEKNIDTLMDELHQSLFPDVEEVAFRALTLDETYGSMQLTVWVSAGEGDLYMLDSEYFNSIAQSEGFLELAPYIEDGTLNVDGMDLSAGYIINQETGKKALYGIPATERPGLKDYGLICDDFCLGVCVTGENEEEALTLLQWMVTNLRGDTAAE